MIAVPDLTAVVAKLKQLEPAVALLNTKSAEVAVVGQSWADAETVAKALRNCLPPDSRYRIVGYGYHCGPASMRGAVRALVIITDSLSLPTPMIADLSRSLMQVVMMGNTATVDNVKPPACLDLIVDGFGDRFYKEKP